MKVRVKVVGPLAQFYPTREGEVDLPEGARAAQLLEVLGLPDFPPPVVVVNDRYGGDLYDEGKARYRLADE